MYPGTEVVLESNRELSSFATALFSAGSLGEEAEVSITRGKYYNSKVWESVP